MATASTGWKCTHTASIISSTNTTATVRVTCYWQNDGWTYDIGYVSAWVYFNGTAYQVMSSGDIDSTGDTSKAVSCGYKDITYNKSTSSQSVSCYAKITSSSSYVSGTKSSSATTVTISAKPSYKVSYNANGGSGAPSSQTKWYGTTLTLSSTKPTRTGYSFQGWATSASGSVAYAAGASYTSNAALTLYAVWKANTYTVSYNANGGSGAPSSQTKTYGVTLTLSSTKPTRTNYNFLGWGTSAGATTVSYAAGASYTSNAAITLYAIWSLAYTKPRISGFSVIRCLEDGTANYEGTYAKVSFTWATDYTVSSIEIYYKSSSATAWSNTTVSASGTSGTVSTIIGAGALSAESSYSFYVTVADSGGTSTSATVTMSSQMYPIDVLAGGNGVSFGKAAETEDLFEVEFPAQFNDTLKLGNYVDQSTTFDGGIKIHDLRNVSAVPGMFGSNNANFYFDQVNSLWRSILSVTGWTGSSYATHELMFNSNTTSGQSLLHRDGVNGSWSALKTILDSANYSNYALPLSGGTLTGQTYLEKASGDTFYYAKRTDTDVQVGMGVGSGGTNHGVYSYTLDKWLIYADASNCYVNGTASGNSPLARGTVKLWSGSISSGTATLSQDLTKFRFLLARVGNSSTVWGVWIIIPVYSNSAVFRGIGGYEGTSSTYGLEVYGCRGTISGTTVTLDSIYRQTLGASGIGTHTQCYLWEIWGVY